MNKIYQGDIGTEFILDCKTDISSATLLQIRARKPSGNVVMWTGTLSGTNHVSYVTTVETVDLVDVPDLDEAGTWKIQAYVETPTWKGLGEMSKVEVYPAYG